MCEELVKLAKLYRESKSKGYALEPIIDRGVDLLDELVEIEADIELDLEDEFVQEIVKRSRFDRVRVSEEHARELLSGGKRGIMLQRELVGKYHLIETGNKIVGCIKTDSKLGFYPLSATVAFPHPLEYPVETQPEPTVLGELERTKPERLVLVNEFISLTGSALVKDDWNDLDVLVRAHRVDTCSVIQSIMDKAKEEEETVRIPKELFNVLVTKLAFDGYVIPADLIEMKMKRAFPGKVSEKFHFFGEPSGAAWSYAPLADLVLVFRQKLEPIYFDESYAYYKSKIKLCEPFKPPKSAEGYHRNEFYVGDEEALWEQFVEPNLKRGVSVLVQPKFDGMRMVIHRNGDRFCVFTEDAKRDRAEIFKPLLDLIKKEATADKFIIDCEFVEWKDGAPLPRESMMWMIVGKEPMGDRAVKVNVHDLVYLEGEDLSELPLTESLRLLKKLFPNAPSLDQSDNPAIVLSPTWEIKPDEKVEEYKEALKKATDYPGSEGAMLKTSDYVYSTTESRTTLWAKYKKVIEISVQVIGRMRKAAPLKLKETLTGEEAVKRYKEAQKRSRTWIFRCAVYDNTGKLVPIESQKKLTKSDLELKWNANLKTPRWQGLEFPELWEMDERFGHREIGELAYGNTYGQAFDDPPEIGDIITVAPVQIVEFKLDNKRHYSWMFPRVKEKTPAKTKPDNLKDFEDIIRAK